MDMEIKAMEPAERLYAFPQSRLISDDTGFLGYLRGDMDTWPVGGFSILWNKYENSFITEEFKAERDEVIKLLRSNTGDDGILKNRNALFSYCHDHPECRFEDGGREYGIRIDTDKYIYLFRLNPHCGEPTFYCFCYERAWLDQHRTDAERGIIFLGTDYKELFRIPDGDQIRVIFPEGHYRDLVCRYIGEGHMEISNVPYAADTFMELMNRHGNKIIPLRSSLPVKCFSITSTADKMVIITKGQMGSRPAGVIAEGKNARESADIANEVMGVTKAQEAAMLAGSIYGWDKPAADPKNYRADGTPIRPKRKDRADTR